MAKKVYVTDAQAEAARMIIERNSARGKQTSEPIRKIATARPERHAK